MKNTLIAALLLFTAVTFAQGKVGTINSDYIVTVMPEFKTMQADLKAYNADLEKQMQDKVKIYQDRLKDLQENGKTFPAATLELKQKQLFDAENDIAKFRDNGSKLLQLKRDELMRPLYEKIGSTLDRLAKEQGYTQVFNVNAGVVFTDPNYDLTMDVLKALGIQIPQ